MSHLLITGATGLLGSYLLADLLEQGLQVACLVRRSGMTESRHRVDHLLRRFDSSRGFSLPRPVVIEGDLNHPHLGIDSPARTWISEHCSGIIHSAASLEFHRNAKTDEPYRTNVESVRRLIDFARQVGIQNFHHVSTAYVCGKRSGTILEAELNAGQEFGNDYEQSKFTAETEVRNAAGFASTTVYRPSIIVGDSRSSYTSTFQGFYTPLQAGYALASRHRFRTTVGAPFLRQLGLVGNEGKNLVPVDWVSSVITHVISQRQLHGRTYHLTNPAPTSTGDIDAAIAEAISTCASERSDGPKDTDTDGMQSPVSRTSAEERWFQDQMATYRNYLRDDPRFDCRNVLEAVPSMPCPAVDRSALVKMAKWAIANRFGLPRSRISLPSFDVDQLLRKNLDPGTSANLPTGSKPAEQLLGICVTGAGGGTWTLLLNDEHVLSVQPGLDSKADVYCRVSTHTLANVAAGSRSLSEVMYAGRLLWEGRRAPKSVSEEAKLFGIIAKLFESETLAGKSSSKHCPSASVFASVESN